LNRFRKKCRPLSRSGDKKPGQGLFVPSLEALDERILPAITATFLPNVGVLTVFGDAHIG
jgi:hypothetical protein